MHRSSLFVEVYKRLLAKGYLAIESAQNSPFESHSFLFLHDVAEKKPEWAIDLFTSWLRDRVEKFDQQEIATPLSPVAVMIESTPNASPEPRPSLFSRDFFDHTSAYDLRKMATATPEYFVKELLPLVLEIITRTAQREGNPPWRDAIWTYRVHGIKHSLPDELEDALAEALALTASQEPETFVRIAESSLIQHLHYKTAGFLLAKGYTGNGERFADSATNFLLSNDDWFRLGYSDSTFWLSRQLLQAITPYVSGEDLKRLEARILSYATSWEKSKEGRRGRGMSQLALLNGITPGRRSPNVQKRLQELQRKFGVQGDASPKGIEVRSVGSPVEANFDKLSDEDWLRIAKKYTREEERNRKWTIDIGRSGGPDEIASDFQKYAKQQPERFASLLMRFPDDTEIAYFDRVLWGIADAAQEGHIVQSEQIWNAIRKVHNLPNRPGSRFLDNIITQYARNVDSIPEDILEIVTWYATEHPDPSPDETRYDDFLTHGLNSIRGGMARAVATILWINNGRYLPALQSCLERMVTDPSMAVRSWAALAVQPVLCVNDDQACDLFLRLCEVDLENEALLGTHHVVQMLVYLASTHFAQIEMILRRMIASPHPAVRKEGASVLTLAATWGNEEALALSQSLCVQSPDEQVRAGTADLLARVLAKPHTAERCFCEEGLAKFFNDDSETVRREASDCFRAFINNNLMEQYPALVDDYIKSRAFTHDTFAFFEALKTTTSALPQVVLEVFERTMELLRAVPIGERIRTGRFIDRDSKLILRYYEQTEKTPALRRRCLDIIDSLARCDTHSLEQAFTENERYA